jgi:hypothetical protein
MTTQMQNTDMTLKSSQKSLRPVRIFVNIRNRCYG